MNGPLDLLCVAPAPVLPRGPRVVTALVGPVQQPSRVDVMLAQATRVRGSDPVDLAVVATAAAETWARGREVPAPRDPFPAHLIRACRLVYQRHHLLVDGAVFARASAALTQIFTEVRRGPELTRHAVLCSVLQDLLNDREEEAFQAVSEVLTRLDRVCARDESAVEVVAAGIAARVREEFAR